ncbi:MAG: hypothetical protein LBI36_02815 [Oscillospiraceae bacterium]|jgi:hypothetical protein|nr:hypothetical protein [Oscillospiraceae bacterium]
MKSRSDENRFCVNHNELTYETDGLFTVLSERSFTLSRAYGARITETASGFIDAEPLIKTPEEPLSIPPLLSRPLVLKQLDHIKKASKHENIRLNVVAPYTLLAELSPPKLPAWLIKHPRFVRDALETLTREIFGYVAAALENGALVISLSDYHAQRNLLGQARFTSFAAEYQRGLLVMLTQSGLHGVIHLCPQSFEPFPTKAQRASDRSYQRSLLQTARQSDSIVILGGQCPHTRYSENLYKVIF